MEFPKVYIVILNYLTWQDTAECLETLLKLDYKNYQIIVVDNASPNQSLSHLKKWAEGKLLLEGNNEIFKKLALPFNSKPISYCINEEGYCPDQKIIFIQSKENNGYAAGNNIALNYILEKDDFEYVWVLNNDTVVETDALRHLVDRAYLNKSQNKRIGLLGSKIMFYYQPQTIQCAGGAIYYKWLSHDVQIGNMQIDKGQFDNDDVKPDFIVGACTFITKDFLKDVGIFSEDYFLYFEEIDLAARARKKNWEMGYVYESKIYHKEGATTGGGTLVGRKKRSGFSEFYHFRSRVLFNKKFGTPIDKIFVNIGLFLVILDRIRRGEFSKAKMRLKIILNPVSAKYKMDES